MSRSRNWCVLLVLLLRDGLVQSLIPPSIPFRLCRWEIPATTDLLPFATVKVSQSPRMHLRMHTSGSPPKQGSHNNLRWSSVKSVLSSILVAGVVLTGTVPSCGLGNRPASSDPSTIVQVVPTWGVPAAGATTFNDAERAIAETWRTVDRLYVDRTFAGQDWFGVRQKALKEAKKGLAELELNAALSKMLASLGDRYTRYLPPAKYDTIVQSSSGDVAGVGVALSTDNERDLPLIVGVESGTPAAEAGLKEGDLLLQISGEDCRGLAPDDAAALLRGAENTKVGLVAERPVEAATGNDGVKREGGKLDLIVTRRKFKVEGVLSKQATINGQNVGIVRIKSFSSNTLQDVRSALESFKSKGVDRVVVDLRGNVGGLLPGGIDTASLFLDSGKDVVFIIRKNGSVEARSTLEKGPNDSWPPLTVLVDKGTASAAEVFTAAVRENDRATLVGERTFGKGVIQTVEPLNSGGGVAVTVARYETPLHHNINKVGILVDREIDCPANRDSTTCDI